MAVETYVVPKEAPIAVIASFNQAGQIKPLYVKLEGCEPAKIVKILSRSSDSPCSVIFKCMYQIDDIGTCNEIKIRYDIRKHSWEILDT